MDESEYFSKKPPVQTVSVSYGSGWIALALLIIYFWDSSDQKDGLMSLHAALVHFLTK